MKIVDLVKIRIGYGFRSKIEHNPSGKVPVVQPRDIDNNGVLRTDGLCMVSEDSVKKARRLKEGDVLLITRGRFVATTYPSRSGDGTIASSALFVLTVKDEMSVRPEYLSLYLNSTKGQQAFNRLTERTTVPYLNRSNLEQMAIPIPDLGTQQKLISLEQAKQRYAMLTTRKINRLNTLINQQLISKETP